MISCNNAYRIWKYSKYRYSTSLKSTNSSFHSPAVGSQSKMNDNTVKEAPNLFNKIKVILKVVGGLTAYCCSWF